MESDKVAAVQDDRTFTVGDFESQAKAELTHEASKIATAQIKSRLLEIAKAKRVLSNLEAQYQALLAKNLDEYVAELQHPRNFALDAATIAELNHNSKTSKPLELVPREFTMQCEVEFGSTPSGYR